MMHKEIAAIMTAYNPQGYLKQTAKVWNANISQGSWHPIPSDFYYRRSFMSNNKINPLLPVGIDPDRNSLAVIFMHPTQDCILDKIRLQNRTLSDAQKLLDTANKLAAKFKTEPAFVIEATNVFWRPIASWLKSQKALVHVVSSKQTHANRLTGMRKTKTDFIDAALIARLFKQGRSTQPYLPDEPYMSLRELSRLNSFLVDLKSKLHNRIYTILYQIHPVWEDAFAHPFTKASLQLMRHEYTHPQKLANASDTKLGELLYSASHGKQGKIFAQNLKSASSNMLYLHEGAEGFSFALKCLADSVIALDNILQQLDERLASLLQELPASVLQSVPGMSTKTVASFVSELGDPSRFSSADKVVAWFGCDPAIDQSGRNLGLGRKMSKSGTKYGRRTMFLATLAFIRAVPQARRKFQQLVRAGRNRREAVCIMAADLIKMCFAMIKSQSTFDPKKV